MEKTQKTKKPLILAAAAFVVLVAAGLVIWKFTAPQGTAGAKAYTFTVVDAEGKETVHELHTDEEMLGAALLNEGLIEGEDSEYGLFVKTVDGITANEDNQEWWSLTIDGEMAMTGVDSTPVEDGGKYEFTLTVCCSWCRWRLHPCRISSLSLCSSCCSRSRSAAMWPTHSRCLSF